MINGKSMFICNASIIIALMLTCADSSANSSNITAISGGYNHTIALKGDGTVWTWGDNWYGQLGDGTSRVERYTPVQVNFAAVSIVVPVFDKFGVLLFMLCSGLVIVYYFKRKATTT